jgi:hypothetical protein
MRKEFTLDRHTHIDHINQNSLDNRRVNLRVCTNSQNMGNRPRTKGNASGYKGVVWSKKDRVWIGQLTIDRWPTEVYRGNSKIKAARAYDDAARKHFGEFACVNFPRRGERGARPKV